MSCVPLDTSTRNTRLKRICPHLVDKVLEISKPRALTPNGFEKESKTKVNVQKNFPK